jgi:hypothetical protein
MRDRDTIDSELCVLAAVRRVAPEHGAGRRPCIEPVDDLLDERGTSAGIDQ